MRMIVCVANLMLVCPLLNATDDLGGLLQLPVESRQQIQQEFENLNRMYPFDQEKKLDYFEGREYKVRETLEFSNRLDFLVFNPDTRGYLTLQLGRIYFGANGYGNALEAKGLRCFVPEDASPLVRHRCTTAKLLALCEALTDLKEEQNTDPYGFCEDSGYYNRMLRDTLKELRKELKPASRSITQDVAEAYKVKGEARKFLRGLWRTEH